MNPQKLLEKLAAGGFHNIDFRDMVRLVERFGFGLERISGSHHIFSHPDIPELINLQETSGEAKPYQVRQFLRLIERYDLRIKERE